MAIEAKAGQSLRVTISRTISRASAHKTLERIFMLDKTVREPLDARSKNFIPLPKRRGGCIWTKRVNKLHPELVTGAAATITATSQLVRDLNSVSTFVQVQPA
jgi:hypothetical protein